MKNVTIILLTLILLGCNKKQNNKVVDTYEVLKVIYDHIITSHLKIVALPQPPIGPPPYGRKISSDSKKRLDSIRKIAELNWSIPKDTIKLMKKLIKRNGRYIVSIDSILRPPYTTDITSKYLKEYLDVGFNEVYTSFTRIKDSISIAVSKIPNNEYSYIIPYRSYYNNMPRKGYDKIDIGLWFTNIAFNQERNKAIIIVGVGMGRLNGFSAIYFLQKRKGEWFIKGEKGLNIS